MKVVDDHEMAETSSQYLDLNWLERRMHKALSPLKWPQKRRGPEAKIGLPSIFLSLIRQKLFKRGALEEHLAKSNTASLEGSTLSRRLRKVDSERLESISDHLLEPIGTPLSNPQGYHRGFRLVGIDGTRFTLQNTPDILGKVPKALTRQRLGDEAQEVAFPQIYASSLVELGPHNPLAVTVGSGGDGELTLASRLLSRLSADDMLLGDRLYGVAWFLHQLIVDSHCGAYLLKVTSYQTSLPIKRLKDGSWIVEVQVRSRTRPADIMATHRVREISYKVQSTNAEGKLITETHRLWTNLTDCCEHPAEELAQLYNTRWEHEGYYKELKVEMKKHKYLSSQLLETAQIEILTMVWASALIARERQRIHEQTDQRAEQSPESGEQAIELDTRSVRFDLVRENVTHLWFLYESVGDIITEKQYQSFADKFTKEADIFRSSKRRRRTCPRKIRQSVAHWPKLRERAESREPIEITVIERMA